MALNGSFSTSVIKGRCVTFTWTATQNVENNSSTINWSLVGGGTSGGYVVVAELRLTINGTQVFYRNEDNRTQCYQGTVLKSGSTTITHNDNGSKSFTVKLEAGIYEHMINTSATSTFTLNDIARASQPSCKTYPNTTSNVGDIGTGFYVHMNRKSQLFTHTVEYSFGNLSGVIGENVENNVWFDMPMEFCNELTNSSVGTGTITVTTYNGSTKVGTKSVQFTCNVPSDIVPTILSYSLQIDNSINSKVNSWNIAVAGFTRARLIATAKSLYGATITSFSISGSYNVNVFSSSLTYDGEILLSSGTNTFSIIAKDSRGRNSAISTKSIDVYPYSMPSITRFVVGRSGQNARKMVVVADWDFDDLNGKNVATGLLKYKKKTTEAWTTYGYISKMNGVELSGDFDEASSYDFMITVEDSLGGKSSTVASASTMNVLLDFKAGGRGFGIGKISENDEVVDVNPDWDFMVHGVEIISLIIDKTHPVGSIYVTTNPENPSVVFPGTTWIPWGSGRIPIGVSDSHPNAEEEFGESSISLTHKHLQTVGTDGNNMYVLVEKGVIDGGNNVGYKIFNAGSPLHGEPGTLPLRQTWGVTGTAGDTRLHYTGYNTENLSDVSIMPPSITCYMWKRIESTRIISNPIDASASSGSKVNFHVEATGDGLTYQWQYTDGYKNNTPIIWVNCTEFGKNTDTLEITMSPAYSGRRFRCVVTDICNVAATSNSAVATMI